jgi:hypothetical protein
MCIIQKEGVAFRGSGFFRGSGCAKGIAPKVPSSFSDVVYAVGAVCEPSAEWARKWPLAVEDMFPARSNLCPCEPARNQLNVVCCGL